MQFLFPTLTWGFFLVLLPLLIHLINLMRQKRVRWAAMDFLLQAQKKHKTWIWLKQMLLLTARMAAVALLVAMLAQLATRSQWSSFFGGRTAHHIVLLDDSFSMSDRTGSESAWDRANRVVTQLAQHVARQDSLHRFTLIRFSRANYVALPAADLGNAGSADAPSELPADSLDAADMMARTVDADFEAGLENVRRNQRVTSLSPSARGALSLAATVVEQSDNESHDVYLISDFRAGEWDRPGELVQSIQRLEQGGAKINLVRCVENPHSNLAITDVRPIEGVQAAGVPLFIEVVVKNFSTEAVRQVTVALRVVESGAISAPAGKAEATVELPGLLIEEIGPGESVVRRAQVYFENAGQHILLAELPADAVIADNRRWRVIDCADGIPVLVVDGDSEQLNARYLQSVFQPSERVRTGLQPDLRPPAFIRDATDEVLAKYHAIYLLDVPRLDDRATRNIEEFVRQGGGVAVFLGPESDLSFYNGWYAGGAGLYPVPVQKLATLPSSATQAPDLQVEDHPIFRVLLGERNPFIGGIRVQQYFQPAANWTPPEGSTIRILADLRSGDPLWVEKRFGDGHLVTQLSSLAPRWNSWATQPTFPVVMLELQAYLNSSPQLSTDIQVGTPIEFTVEPRTYQPRVDFVVPAANETDGKAATIKLARTMEDATRDGQQVGLVQLGSRTLGPDAGATDTPGIYEARLLQIAGPYERHKFALNVDTAESDLELTPVDQLADATSSTSARWLTAEELALSARDDDQFSWSQILLFALVGLLLAEQLLAYSASYHPAVHAVRSHAR